MSFFRLLSIIIISTVLLLNGCSSPTVIYLNLDTTILLPDHQPGYFIPADTALPVTVRINSPNQIPENSRLVIRITDMTDREFSRCSWPLPENSENTIEMTRLIRVTDLPGSRQIRILAGISDTNGHIIYADQTGNKIWHEIISGYALYNTVSWSQGWYQPETGERILRACRGNCILHTGRPAFPKVLHIRGTAPVRCFETNQWTLSFKCNNSPVHEQTVTQDEFSAAITLHSIPVTQDCGSADALWPMGEIEIAILSDKTFDPKVCHGADDGRILAFHASLPEKGDFVPLRGFYGAREKDGHFWPAPDSTVLLPTQTDNRTLFIQGRRDADCIDMPQSVTLTLAGRRLGSYMIDTDTFYLEIPVDLPPETTDSALELNIAVSPVFFRSGCLDTDDMRPYGIGIDEICIR
jgi:hypothetical protein